MRLVIAISIVLLVPLTGSSADIESLTFNNILVEVDLQQDRITYGDLPSIHVGEHLRIPYQIRYLKVPSSFSIEDFVFTVHDSLILAGSGSVHISSPQVTSSANQAIDPKFAFSPGKKAVSPIELILTENGYFLKLMFFPVTIHDEGSCAFNKSITVSVADRIVESVDLISTKQFAASQNITNSMFSPSLESEQSLLIVTDSTLLDAFTGYARYKQSTGIITTVNTIEEIVTEYAGRDNAEKLREYLKDAYEGGVRYVMLGGDETILPVRYAYHLYTSSTPDTNDLQIADLYFADITGDWNADGDNIWGEKYADNTDLTPELVVGRLPFSQPEQVSAYLQKVREYETDAGLTDRGYLTKTFFFSADEMRDYGLNGQHGHIAGAFPQAFTVDTVTGVEQSRGDDLTPSNLSADQLEPVISSGYGIINIISHGSYSNFAVRSSGYNNWPKSFFTTDTDLTGHGSINNIEPNSKTSFYYSLGCDNGAFDKDSPDSSNGYVNLATALLSLPRAGAIGMVANSRWGWVGTSYLMQSTFFDSLFAHPTQPASLALNRMKAVYPYYLDQVYGINYYGDPTLAIQTTQLNTLQYTCQITDSLYMQLDRNIESGSVIISDHSSIIKTVPIINQSSLNVPIDFVFDSTINVSVKADGYLISQKEISPSIATDINDDRFNILPSMFSLEQNYPNPFNPSTTIAFALPEQSDISLVIYNILGQEVRSLLVGELNAGRHEVTWDSKNNFNQEVASGIYFYILKAEDFVDQKKMVLIR